MRTALFLLLALIATACATQSETDPAAEFSDLEVADGIEAITAAQGEPHILWFWGAL